MVTESRRKNDPEWVNYERNGFSWALPFGLGTLSGKGWTSVVALILVGVFLAAGGFVYVTYQGFAAMISDHKQMRESNDRLSCVVTLSESERKEFRSRPTDLPCWWLR